MAIIFRDGLTIDDQTGKIYAIMFSSHIGQNSGSNKHIFYNNYRVKIN